MIKLTRSRTTADVPVGFHGNGRIQRERTLLLARLDHLQRRRLDQKAKHGYKSSWWRPAKDTLRKESHGKCAYCEGAAAAVAHCDVEHFRPKDHWWWLTCCWDNYSFSCQICNQSAKGAKFPVQGTKMTAPVNVAAGMSAAAVEALAGRLAPDPMDPAAVARFETAARREKAELLDPYVDDPAAYFTWEVNVPAKKVKVAPRNATRDVRRRVAACIKLYDLNRDELCTWRYSVYSHCYWTHVALISTASPPALLAQAQAEIQHLISPNHMFAGMCRHFICDVWKLVPRP